MSRVEAAIAALRAGRPVLVTDDADRENEGDVILAAAAATPSWVAWTVRHTSGYLCAAMPEERADALELPPMTAHNTDPHGTAYCVAVDAVDGVTTGISATDRATTLRALADAATVPADLSRPGHVVPLRARPGGVLQRPGHTEAGVDLCRYAGLPPVAAICELVSDDGSMMTGAEIDRLGALHDLPVVTIAELIAYRNSHPLPGPTGAQRVTRGATTRLPTRHGTFEAVGYADNATGAVHIALIAGTPGPGALVRVHSECLTGEAFGSQRCECGPQLERSMQEIATSGGVVVYLRGHEGRGIGLLTKLAAYGLQDGGLDTLTANLALGEPADGREYGAAAAILADLGVSDLRLLTNNPDKVAALESAGIGVRARIPLIVGHTPDNVQYLSTKRDKMGHLLSSTA